MAWNRPTSLIIDALPPEIAEMIMEFLEDSRDILNVFKAYPSLNDQLIMRKRQEWLIDQVAPLLFPYLDKDKLLISRLLSRRWARGFDQFLESPGHSGRHNKAPHTSKDLSREASRAQSKIRNRVASFFFQQCFISSAKLIRLLGKMEEHPSARNPFIGRSLFLGNDEFIGGNDRFWTEAGTFLERFGAHVWYLVMEFDTRISYSGACQVVIRSLPHLPNLRWLCLSMPIRREAADRAAEEFPAGICLSRLEALNFVNELRQPHSSIYRLLVKRYASQIRKLRISSSNWRASYSQILPELEELTLFQGYGRLEDVINVLASLRAPELRRLELHLTLDSGKAEDFQRDIVLWLQPFRKLISVRMIVDLKAPIAFWGAEKVKSLFFSFKKALGWIARKRVAPPLPVTIASLKSLSIDLGHEELAELVNFDFLGSFPKLEYIHINCVIFNRISYFRNVGAYNPRIWDGMLPKLKELNLGYDWSFKCFTREGYEWIEKRLLHNRNACILILFVLMPILIEGLGISSPF